MQPTVNPRDFLGTNRRMIFRPIVKALDTTLISAHSSRGLAIMYGAAAEMQMRIETR